MIKTQKIIKYCAIAFAIFLIFNILSAIMYGIVSISNVFSKDNYNNNTSLTEELRELNIENNIEKLDINVKSVNIIVKEGSKFKVETNNKYINVKETNNKLSITEANHKWLDMKDDTKLTIYIPTDYTFNDVSFENGAGKIEVNMMNTKKLDLDLGAGKVDIQKLNVSTEADIDGGAGEVIIKNSRINNLDLDMGVGKITLNSSLTGNNQIDAGVGELNINLVGTSEDYKIKLNKGIGNATLNDENMKNDTYYGTGNNLIDIDGGVGSIKINYSR